MNDTIAESQSPDLALQDWLRAEADYLAQRPADGSIPRKQLWGEDTIALRAYDLFRDRAK